jgi:membrane protein
MRTLDVAKGFMTDLWRRIGEDDCPGLASEMAYNLILSFVPTLIFLTSLSGLIGGQADTYPLLTDVIQRFAPAPAKVLLRDTMQAIVQGSSAGLTIVGFLGTVWAASKAAGIIVKGLHKAYGLSGYPFPFWYAPLLSVGLVLSLGVLLLAASYLILFGNLLLDWLSRLLALPGDTVGLLQGLRWLIVLVVIHGGITLTYALLLRPRAGRLPWRTSVPGALFFMVSWLSVSWLFSLYVERFPQFNPVYGALGALIILVTWLYYSSLVFFIGGEITALRADITTGVPEEGASGSAGGNSK